jgi:hypothetical protein
MAANPGLQRNRRKPRDGYHDPNSEEAEPPVHLIGL